MNLRYVTLGSIEFQGTPWDGKHGGNSLVGGELLFSSNPSLAWAYKGSWKDPRNFDYAPIPDQYVEFKGSYRSNDKTVLHYTVGDKASEVLEHPWTAKNDQDLVFIRQFQIAEPKKNSFSKFWTMTSLKLARICSSTADNLKLKIMAKDYLSFAFLQDQENFYGRLFEEK